jgi:hypothetical protein
MMLLHTLVCLASALAASATPVSTRHTDNVPNQAALEAWHADINNKTTLIIGSSLYTKIDTSFGLDKRDCVGGTHAESNVDRTGRYWSDWSKVSGCQFTGDSSGDSSISIDTSQTITMQISLDFDPGLSSASSIAKNINAKGGLNLGFAWSESKTTGVSYRCNIPAHSVGSVWQRNLIGWADTAQRRCSMGCGMGPSCGPWKFGHITFPLDVDSPTSRDMGCSTGAAAKCS